MNIKISKIVYDIWLAVLAVLLAACSLEYQPILRSGFGSVRSTCFLLFGMADLLSILMLILDFAPGNLKNGETSCGNSSGFQAESITETPESARFLPYVRQLAAFALATALFWCYCFPLEHYFATNSTIDALVAGGLLCAAAVFGR